jgi:hypothetical protein
MGLDVVVGSQTAIHVMQGAAPFDRRGAWSVKRVKNLAFPMHFAPSSMRVASCLLPNSFTVPLPASLPAGSLLLSRSWQGMSLAGLR